MEPNKILHSLQNKPQVRWRQEISFWLHFQEIEFSRIKITTLKSFKWNLLGFATKLPYLYLISLFYQLCPVFCFIDNSVHT